MNKMIKRYYIIILVVLIFINSCVSCLNEEMINLKKDIKSWDRITIIDKKAGEYKIYWRRVNPHKPSLEIYKDLWITDIELKLYMMDDNDIAIGDTYIYKDGKLVNSKRCSSNSCENVKDSVGLECKIISSKTTYNYSQKDSENTPQLTVALTNISSNTLYALYYLSHDKKQSFDIIGPFKTMVVNSKGERTKLVPFIIEVSPLVTFISITSSGTYETKISLDSFDFSVPDTYQITLYYTVSPREVKSMNEDYKVDIWTGRIKSNTITIQVK